MNLLFLNVDLSSFPFSFLLFDALHLNFYHDLSLTTIVTIKNWPGAICFVLFSQLFETRSKHPKEVIVPTVSLFFPLIVPPLALSSSAGTPGTNFRVAWLSFTLVFDVCVRPRLKPISPPQKVSAG